MRKLSFSDAINEALRQQMRRDPSIFVYGIGVPDHKRIFGSLNHILEEFGSNRCFDTPLCEDTMTGFGIGAAICGMRPVHVHIRVDFLLLAMNQLVNMASTMAYGSGGHLKVPMVIRAIVGRGWGQGYQHSKSLHSYFAHIPGLKVVMPTTPYDAKGMMTAALQDNNPVVFIEHRWLHWAEDNVPEESYTVPIGPGQVLRKGDDITIAATSWMTVEALRAADVLQSRGISVEVVDVRTINPLDPAVVVASVGRTHHCVAVDGDWIPCGVASEMAAIVSEACFGALKAPVNRVGFAFTPCPTVRCLEDEFYPNASTIVRAVEKTLRLSAMDLGAMELYSHERKFKGPF